MSGEEFRIYDREEYLGEFFPDPDGRAEIAAGMDQLRAEQALPLSVRPVFRKRRGEADFRGHDGP